MFTMVSASELSGFGTWAPGFFCNQGYQSLKKYPPNEIMEMGDDYLHRVTDYELKEIINFTSRGFAGPLYVVKAPLEKVTTMRLIDMVSKTVEKRLIECMKHQLRTREDKELEACVKEHSLAHSITETAKTREEHLQISVVIIWIASIMNSDDKRKAAMAKRQRLFDELKEVEKYLGVHV